MSVCYLTGRFGSGLAPGAVPPPAPVNGHAVLRYTHLLQVNSSPGQMIPITPVRLPIIDGVLCGPDGVPSTERPIEVQATDDPLLAQSGAIFAQIDLVFDGGSEPVQVMVALPGGNTVDVATTARAGEPGAVFVSGLSPEQLVELGEGLAQVARERAAAQEARAGAEDALEAAQAHVEYLTAPADSQVATWLKNAGSASGKVLADAAATARKGAVSDSKAALDADVTKLLGTPESAAGAWAKTVVRRGDRVNVLPLLTPTSRPQPGLEAFMQDWAGRVADRTAKRVNILALGDSITEGMGASSIERRWVTQLARVLRSRLGLPIGGRGYISPLKTTNGAMPWPAVRSGSVGDASPDYGPKQQITAIYNNTGKVTYNVYGTHVDIVYPVDPGWGGTLSVSIDGGAAQTFPQNNNATPIDGVTRRFSLGARGPHTVTISSAAAGVWVEGLIEYDGDADAGVLVHELGISGAQAATWNRATAHTAVWSGAIARMDPALLLVALGVNDAWANVPVATYKENVTGLLRKIRAQSPGLPVMFVAYPAAGSRGQQWPAYVQAMYEMAETEGSAVVADLTGRLPTYDGRGSAGTWFDAFHPNDRGHAMIADLLATFLTPS